MKYYYQGLEVKLVPGQQFSSHWNIWVPSGDGKQKIISVHPNQVTSDNSTQVSSNVVSIAETADSKLAEHTLANAFNINEASFLDIKRAFPGIGRVAAKQINDNKPYEGLEDLKRKNSNLNVNWEIFSLLKYE
jgi:hypothetical protein